MFKVNNKNTTTMSMTSHLFLVFLLLALKKKMLAGIMWVYGDQLKYFVYSSKNGSNASWDNLLWY